MFSDFITTIEAQYHARLPFTAYRKPNEGKVKALFQDNEVVHHIKDYTEEGFVFTPFDNTSPAVLLKQDRVLTQDFSDYSEFKFHSQLEHHFSIKEKEFHIHLVKKGIKEIKNGGLKKVVLSRVIEIASKENPLVIFQQLLGAYTKAFCYIWYHPKVGLWLGATPEKLLKVENGILSTNSLAGTQQYTGSLNPSWGQKEKEEQQLVTDYILFALKGVVTDTSVSKATTTKAGSLLHLKTTISAKVKTELLPQIIMGLHPTPAVCGMPKDSSKKFILENENYQREFYTGFLGELNLTLQKERTSARKNTENRAYRSVKKSTELFVNLRCMQKKDDTIFVYVGGGVTKDSDPEKEWEETVNKSHTMLKVLNVE